MKNALFQIAPYLAGPLLVGASASLLGCGTGEAAAVAADAVAAETGAAETGAAGVVSAALSDEPFVHRSELLIPKDAPTFSLTDQNGEAVESDSLAGKVALVGFVYTNCPDICRAITATYLDLQDEFTKELEADDLELILITTDPARDTPERAKAYTEGFGGKWAFVTGSAEERDEVWNSYHVTVDQRVEAVKSQHTWMVVLIDRSSQIRVRYVGQDVPKDILTADVRSMLEQEP